MSTFRLTLVCAVGLAAASTAAGSDDYSVRVRPLLARHCLGCHGPEKPKGELRLDRLAANFDEPASRDKWLAVLARVKAGEMPPMGKPRPAEADVKALGDWIDRNARAAATRRASLGRVALRRLNRAEYENTVRDLLGVRADLKDLLPEDGSAHGFDNVAEALHVSSFLMERYLDAGDKALGLAVANFARPAVIKKRYSLKESHQVRSSQERVYRQADDGTVTCFSSSPWNAVTLTPFYPPDRGAYRFRISVSAVQSAGDPVSFRVDAGPMLMATKNRLVGYFDAPVGKPAVIEFVEHLEARSTLRLLPYGLARAQAVDKVGADRYEGPGLAVHWVEAEGPLHDSWPPPSHRRLFGDLPRKPVTGAQPRGRVEVTSADPEADAARILTGFARRAFRRAVTADDVRPYLALVKSKLAEKQSFEQAVRVGLLGILVSPDFLFLREKPGSLDDFALASRLSYFLWSTTPDEELLALAARGKLRHPDTLRRQVERLLRSLRSAAFTENFVGQWLGLRDIDFTEPSHILYPEYDELLKESMLQEARLYFEDVLKHNRSLLDLVASDYTFVNERLAKHYGLPGVKGHSFRKITLPPDSPRGGVLTMAATLKVTANGTTTSPVVRGAWVLDRILGTPPSPPPAGVPAVEPDIRGATTIRQQLAKHREAASCAACHARIDPPGFALESFDVIGGWRDHYRTVGRGKPVVKEGRRMPYLEGPRVDAADVLADGRRFATISEFKQLLLKDREQIARAMADKLLTYATGGPAASAERRDREEIVAKIREKNFGLRALVHEIVQSRPFQHK